MERLWSLISGWWNRVEAMCQLAGVLGGELGAVRRVLQMRFDRGRLSDGFCRGVELVWCLGGG